MSSSNMMSMLSSYQGFAPDPRFNPISRESVQYSMYGFDRNRDGGIDAGEALFAANSLRYNPTHEGRNLSRFYETLHNNLAGGNPHVDPNGDGKLDYQAYDWRSDITRSSNRPPEFFIQDELSQLAGNDFDPSRISNEDFHGQFNPYPPFPPYPPPFPPYPPGPPTPWEPPIFYDQPFPFSARA